MKKIKLLGNILYWLILAGLIIVAGFTAVSALNVPGNYRLMVVLSGSMEPKIKTGSIVVVKPEENYQKGDVITFRDPRQMKQLVTHRIFEVKDASSGATFVTKGDANNAPDISEVSRDQVLGKTLFSLPYLGHIVNYAKTQQGILVLVIIPAVVIIYSELMTLKNEAIRLIRERKMRKLTPVEEIEEKIGEEVLVVEKEIKKISKQQNKGKKKG